MSDHSGPGGSALGLATCQGPDFNTKRPKTKAPAGACDCHAHVFGPQDRFPYHPARSYDPPEATFDDYHKMHGVLGIERGVLVQSNVYATDNSAIEDAIARSGGSLRGIACVEPDVTDDELARLHAAGFRGIRLNMQFQGFDALDGVGDLARRIEPMGWHLQLLADIYKFQDALPRLTRLAVPVLFDHLGHMPVGHGIDAKPFQYLLAMMRAGGCWGKLSGPYRTTQEAGVPFSDTRPFVDALLETAPDALVWGTDWPHPHLDIPMVNDGDLLDLLVDWVPDEDLRHRILVDNPTVLFFNEG
ncbi:MAG: amidohydrolase family protein [Rhodospirillaceae bacterium]